MIPLMYPQKHNSMSKPTIIVKILKPRPECQSNSWSQIYDFVSPSLDLSDNSMLQKTTMILNSAKKAVWSLTEYWGGDLEENKFSMLSHFKM